MKVPVKVPVAFDGAGDVRGITCKHYPATGEDGKPTYIDEVMAADFAAAGLVEIIGDAVSDEVDPETGIDEDPAADAPDGSDHDALLRWLREATKPKLTAWLARRGMVYADSVTVPSLKGIAYDVAEREAGPQG